MSEPNTNKSDQFKTYLLDFFESEEGINILDDVRAKMSSMHRPHQYAIYKNQGCAQFNLMRPSIKKNNEGYYKEGVVFLEMANSSGSHSHDWDNKIIFALSCNDLAKLYLGFQKGHDVVLIHDPNAQSDKEGLIKKTLTLKPGEKTGTFFLTLTERKGGDTLQTKVSIQLFEAFILSQLFSKAISKILDW